MHVPVTERLLHFIWQFQYLNASSLITTDGSPVKVIRPGHYNKGQGPDFLQAHLQIDGTLWVGNVEIHIKTSDWLLHRHSGDVNFKNVVLHVVWEHDSEILTSFPTLSIQEAVPAMLLGKYLKLVNSSRFVPCETMIAGVNEIHLEKWKERLTCERLEQKSKEVLRIYEACHNNREETAWRLLARQFGATTNADAFEMLACSIPVTVLHKNRHHISAVEAILLGQAGLLPPSGIDEYSTQLIGIYQLQQRKYQLRKPTVQFHYLRMRPANFPTIRLAQLAAFLCQNEGWFTSILTETDTRKLKQLFATEAKGYWLSHYRFGKEKPFAEKRTGSLMQLHLLINVVVVLRYAFAVHLKQDQQKTKAMELLQALAPEHNVVCTGFTKIGLRPLHASDSQALLQLKLQYCDQKRCLECGIGLQILKPST